MASSEWMEDLSLEDRNTLDIHELWHLSQDIPLGEIVDVTLHPEYKITSEDVDKLVSGDSDGATIHDLPNEILHKIFSFMDIADLMRLRPLRRTFAEAIDARDDLWEKALKRGKNLV